MRVDAPRGVATLDAPCPSIAGAASGWRPEGGHGVCRSAPSRAFRGERSEKPDRRRCGTRSARRAFSARLRRLDPGLSMPLARDDRGKASGAVTHRGTGRSPRRRRAPRWPARRASAPPGRRHPRRWRTGPPCVERCRRQSGQRSGPRDRVRRGCRRRWPAALGPARVGRVVAVHDGGHRGDAWRARRGPDRRAGRRRRHGGNSDPADGLHPIEA